MSEATALQGAELVRGRPASSAVDADFPSKPAVAQPQAAPRLTARGWALVMVEVAGLWGTNKAGYAVVAQLHVPLPGNVAGMLLLFALLCTKVVPMRLFEQSSTLLARHLPFFFVPIAVGLMNLAGTLLAEGWQLLLVLIASAAVGLCTTGWLAQLLSRLKAKP